MLTESGHIIVNASECMIKSSRFKDLIEGFDWDVSYMQFRKIIRFIHLLNRIALQMNSNWKFHKDHIKLSRVYFCFFLDSNIFVDSLVLCVKMKTKITLFWSSMSFQIVCRNNYSMNYNFNFLTFISITKNTLSSSAEFSHLWIISTIRYFDYLHSKFHFKISCKFDVKQKDVFDYFIK